MEYSVRTPLVQQPAEPLPAERAGREELAGVAAEPALLPLLFIALGFAPIGALCAALFEWIPLTVTSRWLVLPAAGLALIVGLSFRRWGSVALIGLTAGIVATGVYDLFRLSLHALGLWGDFIPVIGQMIFGSERVDPAWGYLWRFLGNGGCMGVSFMIGFELLRRQGSQTSIRVLRHAGLLGMLYATAVCGCLFGTLLLAPGAQGKLFVLTPLTAAGAMGGHWIYGAVLGRLGQQWLTRTENAAPDAD